MAETAGMHKMIRETVTEISEDFGHNYWRECVENDEFPRELWDTLSKHGYTGIQVPQEYGGSGMGIEELALVIETLAKNGLPSFWHVIHTAMAPEPILQYGSDEMKERFLPGIASGGELFCFGITEPAAGLNVHNITTTAEPQGDSYIINGEKTYISGAEDADYIQLVTKVSGEDSGKDDFLLLLVDLDLDGIELIPMDLAIEEECGQFQIHFDDVAVPKKNRVGEEGEGLKYVFCALNPERIATASIAIGLGKFVTQKACNYASKREVFDVPIGSHQAIQHPLSKAHINLRLASLANTQAAELYDEGESVDSLANIAHYAGSIAADEALDTAMQTFGGAAFDRDYGVVNVDRLIRLYRIAPVSNEMILNYIGTQELGLPKSY